jgi:hypothetical protein
VFDGWEQVVATGRGGVSVALGQGLYTVRVERGGAMVERVVRHARPTSTRVTEPLRNSAMPTFDTADAHEYYSWTAHQWSTRPTGTAPAVFGAPGAAPGGLFIFVRAQRVEEYLGEDLSLGLSLRRLDGQVLTTFDRSVTERHDDGWLAFMAPAPPGCYLLRHSGLTAREIPLHVFANWHTQVFIPFSDRPRLERTTCYLARPGAGFHPDDRMAQGLDAALAGLQSGRNLLSPDAQEALLGGKFENPVLGLVGAHLLLLGSDAEPNLIDMVLQNLHWLLGPASDVRAIEMLAALRFGRAVPPGPPVVDPPMLRRGLDAVVAASVKATGLVPEGSFIDQIAAFLHGDSAWSVWTPPVPDDVVAGLEGRAVEVRRKLLPDLERLVSIPGSAPATTDPAELRHIVERILGASLDALVTDPELRQSAERVLARSAKRLGVAASDDLARRLGSAFTALLGASAPGARPLAPSSSPALLPGRLPEWVVQLMRDAVAKGLGSRDLATLATRAGLPLSTVTRAMREVLTPEGSGG